MFKFSRYVQDASGNVQVSGTVDVWVAGTGQSVRSTIYSDNTGTAKANPFAIPTSGLVEFYLANGRFDVTTTTAAGTVTITDQKAFDTDELSGDISVLDNLTVDETLTVNGAVTIGGALSVAGAFSPSLINTGARSDVASATTINLDTTPSNYVRITGTTTITAITLTDGRWRDVVFGGVLILTNGASLILPGAENITTAAGDTMRVMGEAAGVARVVSYTHIATTAQAQSGTNNNALMTPKAVRDSILLSRTTVGAAVASVDISTAFAGYRHFVVEMDSIRPVTDGSALWSRLSHDSGATFVDTGNQYHTIGLYHRAGIASGSSGLSAVNYYQVMFGLDNGLAKANGAATMKFFKLASTSEIMGKLDTSHRDDAARLTHSTEMTMFLNNAGAAVNAIRFLMSAGNIDVGSTFSLYGIP